MLNRLKFDFIRDTRGNLSITAGVVGMMLLAAVGASLDGGRMFTTKQKLQSISDAAALMAMTPDGVSAQHRRTLAATSIESHVKNVKGITIKSSAITVNDADGQVHVALSAEVPMLFGAVMGSDMRSVSVSSLAEESRSKTLNPLSISLVLDLSPSMANKLDNSSKLASVNAAVSDMFNAINNEFGGEVAAATRVSTGVYPFNWGMVDGETVALEPGTSNVVNSLNYLALSSGSVPTTAMERAVEDQLAEMKTTLNRDRYIVYVTDGKVDEDKADRRGRFMPTYSMFAGADTRKCRSLAKRIVKLDEKLEPENFEAPGLLSPILPSLLDLDPNVLSDLGITGHSINTGNDDDDDDDDNTPKDEKNLKSAKHAGHAHASQRVRNLAKRNELREEYIAVCQPEQTLRVAEACEEAREKNISIIAINLSGEDGIASNTTNDCINGVDVLTSKEFKAKKKLEEKLARQGVVQEGEFKTLPSGIKVRISADGHSIAGDATSLDEIRDMLSSVLPDGKTERRVRLVG